MPYNPTSDMVWAAKRIDPAITLEHCRALWCAMWSAAPVAVAAQPVAQGLTDDLRKAAQKVLDDWYALAGQLPQDDRIEALEWGAMRQLRSALSTTHPAQAAEGDSIDVKRFERAPCYLCGYNGAGYYQPSSHACSKRYHATKASADEGGV
jgi:hypothetical protein